MRKGMTNFNIVFSDVVTSAIFKFNCEMSAVNCYRVNESFLCLILINIKYCISAHGIKNDRMLKAPFYVSNSQSSPLYPSKPISSVI